MTKLFPHSMCYRHPALNVLNADKICYDSFENSLYMGLNFHDNRLSLITLKIVPCMLFLEFFIPLQKTNHNNANCNTNVGHLII